MFPTKRKGMKKLGNFLYFPENKLEYIPSLFSLFLVIFLAFFVVRLLIKNSKREEEKAKILEKELLTKHHEGEKQE